jgi:hypothetical protein
MGKRLILEQRGRKSIQRSAALSHVNPSYGAFSWGTNDEHRLR